MPASDHAEAFYREVAVSQEVYTLEYDDGDGVPLWPLDQGRKARPFWSSARRIREMLDGPLAKKRLRIAAFTWHGFVEGIAPDLEAESILVGVNWHGPRARGYNVPVNRVIAAVDVQSADAETAETAETETKPEQPLSPKPPPKHRGTPILADPIPDLKTDPLDDSADFAIDFNDTNDPSDTGDIRPA
ncbi:MAG: DUF2750 domain-containing protein [Planctomycetota bacterium]